MQIYLKTGGSARELACHASLDKMRDIDRIAQALWLEQRELACSQLLLDYFGFQWLHPTALFRNWKIAQCKAEEIIRMNAVHLARWNQTKLPSEDRINVCVEYIIKNQLEMFGVLYLNTCYGLNELLPDLPERQQLKDDVLKALKGYATSDQVVIWVNAVSEDDLGLDLIFYGLPDWHLAASRCAEMSPR